MSDVRDYSHLPDFRSDETKEVDRLHAEIARLRETSAMWQKIAEDGAEKQEVIAAKWHEQDAEIARLRREKEALVEEMKSVRRDLVPIHLCDVVATSTAVVLDVAAQTKEA